MFQNSKFKTCPREASGIQNSNGFTLIEILITIAIFAIILSIVIVATRSFSDTVNLDNAGKIIGTNIKLAKMRSVGALNDTNYGVRFEGDKITVFAGDTFDVSDPTNKVVNLSDGVKISGISLAGGGVDLVFNRLTGTTNNAGTIEIELVNNSSEKKQIVINEEGQIDHVLFPTSLTSPITNARHVHYSLGWNIESSTILRFERIESGIPTVNDIDVTVYFNADKSEFDWSGETIIGSSQTAKIHGWLDGSNNTILCVILDQTESDTLNIYFVDGATKGITTYKNNGGVIEVEPDSFYVGAMDIK